MDLSEALGKIVSDHPIMTITWFWFLLYTILVLHEAGKKEH
jgi:hypothetical protein